MADAFMDVRPNKVKIGTEMVEVREVPLKRLKKFRVVWAETVERFESVKEAVTKAQEEGQEFYAESVFDEIVEFALEIPYDLLSVLIPDMTKEAFEGTDNDDDSGVTFPQIQKAFEAVVEANNLGWLANQLPFFRDLASQISLSSMMEKSQTEDTKKTG